MLCRILRSELEAFVSACGSPEDASFYSSIRIPGCLGIQKCDKSAFFSIVNKMSWLMELR